MGAGHPEQVGPYRLERPLGRGGVGEVWAARHVETGAPYAVKLLRPLDGQDLLRFQREAEALARLDHPHLVRVHAAGAESGRAWLAQELLPGGTLQERLQAGPLPPEEARQLLLKLCAALEHAHGRGVLHRDLKPQNVVFDERGEPKLVDFGLALLTGEAGRLTRSGEVLGTPAYMAPEQLVQSAGVDARCDVYGLGGILYASLTGAAPHSGRSAAEVLASVAHRDPRPPRALRAEVPAGLEAACLRAMARDPAARFQEVARLAQALRGGELPAAGASRRVGRGLLALAALGALTWAALRALAPPELPLPPRPADGGASPAGGPRPAATPVEEAWRAALAGDGPEALEALAARGPLPPSLAGEVATRWRAEAAALLGGQPPAEFVARLRPGSAERARLRRAVGCLARARAADPSLHVFPELGGVWDAWSMAAEWSLQEQYPPDPAALLDELLELLPGDPVLCCLRAADVWEKDPARRQELLCQGLEALRDEGTEAALEARGVVPVVLHEALLFDLRGLLSGSPALQRYALTVVAEADRWPVSPGVAHLSVIERRLSGDLPGARGLAGGGQRRLERLKELVTQDAVVKSVGLKVLEMWRRHVENLAKELGPGETNPQ